MQGYSVKKLHNHKFKMYVISSEGFVCVSKWKNNICDKLKIYAGHMFSFTLSKLLTVYTGVK
jgi:hypothetical protein